MNNHPSQDKDEKDRLILAIKEEEVSVSPESSVEIHVAIINRGTEDEYVDVLVKGVPSEWLTIEKPVVHIHAGETVQLKITVQPPAVPSSRVGQYPLDVKITSQSDPEYSVTTHSHLTVAAYQSMGRIGILLSSIYFSISPGSSVNIPILLQNRGQQEDNFKLGVTGVPAGWVSSNSTFTKLEPGASKEIQLTLQVPRTPETDAGRTPFRIQFTSQSFPDQKAEAECILTVAAFSKFSASLSPETLEAGQTGSLIVENEGNTTDTYYLNFLGSGNLLAFEKGVPVSSTELPDGTQQVELGYAEIPQNDTIQVAAGQKASYPFRSIMKLRPLFGGVQSHPFKVQVNSTAKKSAELTGQVSVGALLPAWLWRAALVGSLILCLLALYPINNIRNSTRATQTAIFSMTQSALLGQDDSDGDGLSNSTEVEIGTDLNNADTDGDGLSDGDEVNTHLTNPLLSDTDTDGLSDSAEITTHLTNPLVSDTDEDILIDGDEVTRGTNPLIFDTDQDGLGDGAEVNLGTDPLQQDTDKDLLPDGLENQTCPLPLQPDSDGDGIIDGNDLNPCDTNNPSLTATALSILSTQTPPTAVQTNNPQQITTPNQSLPANLQGIVVFESNRSGNPDIYAVNLEDQSLLQITDNPAIDTQPALAPDSLQVVYVSNQNGNNEIFLGGLDRRAPVNLTNNSADDQSPAWSPDGNWITFTSNRDGNQEIYVMRSDGSELHSLTNNAANDFDPTWFSVPRLFSTDEWIAFTSTRDGNLEIYKIRPDGTELTNLTKNMANDYSPSGVQELGVIVFVTDRDGNPEIYTMLESGGAPANISNHPLQDLDPSLGPGGEWIVFASDREGNLEVYVTDNIGSVLYNLSGNSGRDRYPDW